MPYAQGIGSEQAKTIVLQGLNFYFGRCPADPVRSGRTLPVACLPHTCCGVAAAPQLLLFLCPAPSYLITEASIVIRCFMSSKNGRVGCCEIEALTSASPCDNQAQLFHQREM